MRKTPALCRTLPCHTPYRTRPAQPVPPVPRALSPAFAVRAFPCLRHARFPLPSPCALSPAFAVRAFPCLRRARFPLPSPCAFSPAFAARAGSEKTIRLRHRVTPSPLGKGETFLFRDRVFLIRHRVTPSPLGKGESFRRQKNGVPRKFPRRAERSFTVIFYSCALCASA